VVLRATAEVYICSSLVRMGENGEATYHFLTDVRCFAEDRAQPDAREDIHIAKDISKASKEVMALLHLLSLTWREDLAIPQVLRKRASTGEQCSSIRPVDRFFESTLRIT
jgi:hypothetical protein